MNPRLSPSELPVIVGAPAATTTIVLEAVRPAPANRLEWLVPQATTEESLQPGQLGPGRDVLHLVRPGSASDSALCGVDAAYGWGRDLFVHRGCSACKSSARRLRMAVPSLSKNV